MTAQQALAHANARIDQLQQLADTQAQIITAKNNTIAQLRTQVADLEAALAYCQAHSYADDLIADCEVGAMEVTA